MTTAQAGQIDAQRDESTEAAPTHHPPTPTRPGPADPFAMMAAQLAGAAAPPSAPPRQFNPRPPGVMQGGATTAVLGVLQARPGRFFRLGQLRAETGCSRAALGWALIRLRRWGLVEVIPDGARNSRYMRYRAVQTESSD